jgi:class 3 adenylate cyclase
VTRRHQGWTGVLGGFWRLAKPFRTEIHFALTPLASQQVADRPPAFQLGGGAEVQAGGIAGALPGGRGPARAPRGRHKKSTNEFPTERKYVTILRADLHRSSDLVAGLDLEESIARLAPALEQMRLAVRQSDGIIHREMGDGVFAVFGAPVANDLHAIMACVAALDLLQRIEALEDASIRVRIGVHSGLVVAGPRQLDYSRMYDFDGPPLILAERLQAVALPGQALASQSCRALADGYIHFGPAQHHTLKGFASPVAVYPIVSVGQISKWQVTLGRGTTRFIGRESEFEKLLALSQAVANGAGHVGVVSGEPGIGKSRLAREAQVLLRQRGWQCLEVECSSIFDAPYSLLKGLLLSVMRSSPVSDAAVAAELVPAQLDALRIIVHDVAPEHCTAWARLTPQARGRAIVDMACKMLTRLIDGRPTLLLIEDVQWSDESSAPAMEAIANLTNSQPLLVLSTARTGDVPGWLEKTTVQRFELKPLGRVAGLAMLDELLGSSSRLAPLKVRILEHTGAMPLFVEEVCRGLFESGRLLGSWGEFEPASSELDLGVPVTVQGVIASRIDRLSAREKRVLQVAAAIGPQVPSHLLQVISALEVSVFRRILNALIAAGLLISTQQTAQGETSFAHECVRQVAYDAALETDRVRLHKAILAQLERDALGQHGQELETAIVHHAVGAKEWARAAELAAAIARRCFGQAAFLDARRHFELAIASTDKLPPSPSREATAIDLRIEARMAYGNLGEVSRWLDLAKEAESRAIASGDQMRRIPALAMRAAALNFCGTPAEAIELGEVAVREAARSGELGWLAYAEYGLGQARFIAGCYLEAVEVLESAYRRFRFEGASPPPGAGPAQAALLSCMMICVSQIALGDEKSAADAQSRADTISVEKEGPAAAIAAGFSRGALMLARNEPIAAETSLAQSLKLARQHEIHLFIPVLANQHGLALLWIAQPDRARAAFQTAREEAGLLGHRSAALRAELGLVLCDLANGSEHTKALESVLRCEQIARQGGYRPLELEALIIRHALLDAIGLDGVEARSASEALVTATGANGSKRDLLRLLDRVLHLPG